MVCNEFSNLTYCGLNTFEKIMYTFDSPTPLGISLWNVMAIGLIFIVVFMFLIWKPIFDRLESQELEVKR